MNSYQIGNEIKTLNRRIGQLNRYYIWNRELINMLSERRYRLQEDLKAQLAREARREQLVREVLWASA